MLRKLSISTKLVLLVLPLLALAVFIVAYFITRYQMEEMVAEKRLSAQTYTDLIRESLVDMMTTREQVDDRFLSRLASVRDIRDLHIHFTLKNLHLDNRFLDTVRVKRLKEREKRAGQISPEEERVFKSGIPSWEQRGSFLNAVIPFKAEAKCQQCHDVPINHVLGVAEMNISLTRVTASEQGVRNFTIWILYAFVSAVVIVGVSFRIVVASRMKVLLDATKRIGSGNLDDAISAGSSADELGEIASAFENMRVKLKSAQDKLIHAERLSAIGQMASSIIHDFRTPISTINLSIDSLQRGREVTAEKAEQLYRLIRDAIHRMVTMAQELLDFSRGDAHLNKAEYAVGDFMALLVRSVETNLDRAKVALKLEERFKGAAVFDADRLHRALVNIINNAQDAMPNGGTLRISTGKEDGSIVFSIADSGNGIPPDIREKIFDAFVTWGKKKGTGLGLAITKRIIDQHGGTIDVLSEQGKGTTFTIRIPAESAETT